MARSVVLLAALALGLVSCPAGDPKPPGNPTPPPGGGWTGQLEIAVTGLPSGVEAGVRVSGPNGYARDLTASQVLTDLEAGSYAVSASSVASAGVSYAASVSGSPASVAAGASATIRVGYAVDPSGRYEAAPDNASCNEGRLSSAEKQEALDRVNYLRGLSDLPPVGYSAADDGLTQKAALIISANAAMSHFPPADSLCYSDEGALGSKTSNLYIARTEGAAVGISTRVFVDGWVVDVGVPSLGHRRWILDPFLKHVSYGRVDGRPRVGPWNSVTGAVLRVINDEQADLSGLNLDFVAYPKGNYPKAVFNKTWFLSFSVVGDRTSKYAAANRDVDFGATVVRVSTPEGGLLDVSEQSSNGQGFGVPNHLQWKVAGLQDNLTYTVGVSNVLVAGTTRSYSYAFRLR